ncbi:hypothetical protein [Streptomyces sp. NPDC007856]|uniref:hypothetical protein n=1 Tax=Streptomyces sp. NPDC007856 TaxID=3364781 RepID=UPI0036C35E08
MTTPADQRSSSATFGQTIQILEATKGSLSGTRSEVSSRVADLAPHYMAEDGNAFQRLMVDWEEQVMVLENTCQELIEHLGDTNVRAAAANSQALSNVRAQETRVSGSGSSAYTTMMG